MNARQHASVNMRMRFQAILFAVAGLAALSLLVGRWTQRAAFVSWLLLVSLHHRQPLVLTGGDCLLALLLFWSLFLPLSTCWSLDSRRALPAARSSPLVTSAASAALLLQVAFVYLFAAAFKLADPAWQRLTAVLCPAAQARQGRAPLLGVPASTVPSRQG